MTPGEGHPQLSHAKRRDGGGPGPGAYATGEGGGGGGNVERVATQVSSCEALLEILGLFSALFPEFGRTVSAATF